ncbi:Tripartite motif-containing protein 16 [Liparis tanakae]|uniref:Tripartite motif-containing protein 16 n=1 Tax=Liparis tanakae TaxID=230148 RepID=A0A4Z2EAB4_9TELE|nr:Tripartite motif-containing protein 16 [Liparis tanakae]
MSCIKSHWDEEDAKKLHSCPQCRQTFTPRPVLVKNTMLADLVEEMKKTGLQAAPADHCYAGAEDVACDVCTGRRLKALKSCLVCLASYCEKHLQRHYDVPPLKKHKLVDPSNKLQENICSRHNEVMKIYCRNDQQCICYLCLMNEHKGHDTVLAAEERTERQKELEGSRLIIQKRILNRENDLKLLHQELEVINLSANKTVEDSEKSYANIIRFMKKRRSKLKQQVRSQQKAEASRVKELQEKLEQEITELKKNDAELEKISQTEDLNQFLQNFSSLSPLNASSINICPLRYFEDVTAAVSEDSDEEVWTDVSLTVSEEDVLPSHAEPKTRAGFLKFSREITLDPNTAHTWLSVSDGNKKATLMKEQQTFTSHPDTFNECLQVLSRESLTGRSYWEVEWRGEGAIVALAYKDIPRKGEGEECVFGVNNQSWALTCLKESYVFFHNKVHTPVSGPVSNRIGVYLDHSAGTLSFYSVSATMTLLHRVQTTFTQPLYAGFSLYYSFGYSADFCKLK